MARGERPEAGLRGGRKGLRRELRETAAREGDAHGKKRMRARREARHSRGRAHGLRRALEEGKCVVIGLQSTGESHTTAAIEKEGDELDDFVSAPRASVEKLLMRFLPLPEDALIEFLQGALK